MRLPAILLPLALILGLAACGTLPVDLTPQTPREYLAAIDGQFTASVKSIDFSCDSGTLSKETCDKARKVAVQGSAALDAAWKTVGSAGSIDDLDLGAVRDALRQLQLYLKEAD